MRTGAIALAVLALAGCGGSETPKPPSDEAVVRRWAEQLRAGNVAGAVEQFRVPVVVANGGPKLLLRTQAEIEFFNVSLPCGARLVSTRRGAGGRLVGTFRLTERAGPHGGGCGSGTGALASVAFRFRDHRISEWLRVADPEPAGAEV
jgi:hypothetical protein